MTYFDIEHEGRKTLNVDREGAEALGYPEAVIAAAETIVAVGKISDECRRRIYAKASAETQMNMASVVAVISAKTAASRSTEETATLDGLEAATGWVGAMRANIATLAADPSLDPSDDANWPNCPAEVIALVAQF